MEGRGGTLALGGTLPRHHQIYPPQTGGNDSRVGGKGRGMENFGVVGFTSSLRGRSSSVTRPRATTSTVAAALMASRTRNASDNALDQNTSILPIFQKLLSERSANAGRRDCTMSSCPNITIKCDIVEYLWCDTNTLIIFQLEISAVKTNYELSIISDVIFVFSHKFCLLQILYVLGVWMVSHNSALAQLKRFAASTM